MKSKNHLFPKNQKIKNQFKDCIKNHFWILLSIFLFIINCQHARIRFIPDLPDQCIPWSEKNQNEVCQASLEIIRNDLAKKKTVEKEFPQIYTYWGFKPEDIQVDLNKECPKGVYEIHQYSTLMNAIYEQLTIGFYSPRTLRLTCYE